MAAPRLSDVEVLSVKISTRFEVSQPEPFSPKGETRVVPQEQVDVTEGRNQLLMLEQGTTLEAVVRGLNALGASPRDIIAIMQALKAAGAARVVAVGARTQWEVGGPPPRDAMYSRAATHGVRMSCSVAGMPNFASFSTSTPRPRDVVLVTNMCRMRRSRTHANVSGAPGIKVSEL